MKCVFQTKTELDGLRIRNNIANQAQRGRAGRTEGRAGRTEGQSWTHREAELDAQRGRAERTEGRAGRTEGQSWTHREAELNRVLEHVTTYTSKHISNSLYAR